MCHRLRWLCLGSGHILKPPQKVPWWHVRLSGSCHTFIYHWSTVQKALKLVITSFKFCTSDDPLAPSMRNLPLGLGTFSNLLRRGTIGAVVPIGIIWLSGSYIL